ncbi:MAG: EAL domain-containing protein [Pseudomonadota bacterium]
MTDTPRRQKTATAFPEPLVPVGCAECRRSEALGFTFTMAFQPIVDVDTGRPWAYEALVRGSNGEGAGEVLAKVTDQNRYRFDQVCRVEAIELAAKLGLHRLNDYRLCINLLPNAVYRPGTCIRSTLEACALHSFPSDRRMSEVTESEPVRDASHLIGIFNDYRKRGFATAIDDFGAGYAGLNLLTMVQPQAIKLEMELTRSIDTHPPREAIVAGIILTAEKLGITLIAEGVETAAERDQLRTMGIKLQQDYRFARPQVEALPLKP